MGCILRVIGRKHLIQAVEQRSVSYLNQSQQYIIPKSPIHEGINYPTFCFPKQKNQKLNIKTSQRGTLEKDLIKGMTKSTFKQEHQTEQAIRVQSKKEYFQVQQKLQNLLQQQSYVLKLIEKAANVNKQQLFIQLKAIYLQLTVQIQILQTYCSDQSLQEVKAYIYSRLTDISISEKNHQESNQFFYKAIKAYTKTSQLASIEQRITLLNNYSVYKNSCGKLQQAKKSLREAIDLMSQYFIDGDDRKYLSFINLACLEYESRNKDQGRKILLKIYNQCKNEEIISLAKKNQKYYSQLIFKDP